MSGLWNLEEDWNDDDLLDDDLYDDEDFTIDLEDDDDIDEDFERKCANCGAIMEDSYVCEVCGWLAGV